MEPEHIRASDADRDRVADRLRDALTQGRLDHTEYDERLDSVYRAKTVGDLAHATHDLPDDSGSQGADSNGLGMQVSTSEARELAAGSQGHENLVAVFGGAERKGRWLVEPRTNASVLFGGVSLDFREAILTQREVTVQCAVVFGGLEIVVPHGVRVVNSTTAILGGTSMHGTDAVTDPSAPTIRLTGTCMFGGIEVHAKASGDTTKK